MTVVNENGVEIKVNEKIVKIIIALVVSGGGYFGLDTAWTVKSKVEYLEKQVAVIQSNQEKSNQLLEQKAAELLRLSNILQENQQHQEELMNRRRR